MAEEEEAQLEMLAAKALVATSGHLGYSGPANLTSRQKGTKVVRDAEWWRVWRANRR